MKYRCIFLQLFLMVHLAMTNLVAENPDTLKTYHLQDSIIVVASRYRLSFATVTNSVDMIDEKKSVELANHSVLQLVDMLSPSSFVLEKKVLGFGVGSNGSGNITLRGLGNRPNTATLVLINGRPDFMGIFGHPLPDVYGLEGFQQVEVIKGPSSTLFGSNAMGGVINLVTRSESSNAVRLKVGGGSHQTFFQNTQLGYNGLKLKLNGFLSHQRTAGHLDSTDFESWNMNGKLEYQFSGNWKASVDGRYVPFQFNDPFMGENIAKLGSYGKIRRGMIDAGIEGKKGRLQNSFHLYSNLGHHRFSDGFESHDFTYGISSYQNFTWSSKLLMSFGLDALHYGGKARNAVLPDTPPQPDLHTINTLGIYFIGFYSANTFLSLQAGGRFHHSSLAEDNLTPSLGISLVPVSSLKIFGNYNQGFRLPTIQELYLFPASNPDLITEKVAGYEAGLLYQFHGQNFVKGSFFYNQVKNLIQQVANPAPPPRQIFVNGESAEQRGAEITLQFKINSPWLAQFSYSYIHPDILTAFNPENMFKYYLSYNHRLMRLTLFGKSVSKWYAENYSRSPLAGYQLVNLSGTFGYKNLTLDIQLRNLLDRRYEVLPDYPAPGFHFLTSVTFQWDYSEAFD